MLHISKFTNLLCIYHERTRACGARPTVEELQRRRGTFAPGLPLPAETTQSAGYIPGANTPVPLTPRRFSFDSTEPLSPSSFKRSISAPAGSMYLQQQHACFKAEMSLVAEDEGGARSKPRSAEREWSSWRSAWHYSLAYYFLPVLLAVVSVIHSGYSRLDIDEIGVAVLVVASFAGTAAYFHYRSPVPSAVRTAKFLAMSTEERRLYVKNKYFQPDATSITPLGDREVLTEFDRIFESGRGIAAAQTEAAAFIRLQIELAKSSVPMLRKVFQNRLMVGALPHVMPPWPLSHEARRLHPVIRVKPGCVDIAPDVLRKGCIAVASFFSLSSSTLA